MKKMEHDMRKWLKHAVDGLPARRPCGCGERQVAEIARGSAEATRQSAAAKEDATVKTSRIGLSALFLVCWACGVWADVPAPLPITVNSQQDTAPQITLHQSSPRTIRAQFRDGGAVADLTGLTTNDLHLTWSLSATSAAYVASDVAVYNATNGQADFTFSAGDLNYASGRYIYEVAAGSTIIRQGTLILLGSPFATGTNSPNWTTNINLAGYQFSNQPWLEGVSWTNGASNSAAKVGNSVAIVFGPGGGGSTTDATARAWATAASNLALSASQASTDATARAWAQAGSNMAASALAQGYIPTSGVTALLAGYATGTPVYVDLGATGAVASGILTLTYNSTTRTVTGSADTSGLATGTPLYVNSALSQGYIPTSGVMALLGAYATGSPVYAETDPVFAGQSNALATAMQARATVANLNAASGALRAAIGLVDTNGAAASNALRVAVGLGETNAIAASNALRVAIGLTTTNAVLADAALSNYVAALVNSNAAFSVQIATNFFLWGQSNAAFSVLLGLIQTNNVLSSNAASAYTGLVLTNQAASNAALSANFQNYLRNDGGAATGQYIFSRSGTGVGLSVSNSAASGSGLNVYAGGAGTLLFLVTSNGNQFTFSDSAGMNAFGNAIANVSRLDATNIVSVSSSSGVARAGSSVAAGITGTASLVIGSGLGADVIPNGTFATTNQSDTDAANWTFASGASRNSGGGGYLQITAGSTGTATPSGTAARVGASYAVGWTNTDGLSWTGSVTVTFGGWTQAVTATTGSVELTMFAVATNGAVLSLASTAGAGGIDGVTITHKTIGDGAVARHLAVGSNLYVAGTIVNDALSAAIAGGSATTALQLTGGIVSGPTTQAVAWASQWNTLGNSAAGLNAVVAGGTNNSAVGNHSFIGGGSNNYASGSSSVVGGGFSNSATVNDAVIGGGRTNIASASAATVAGGRGNVAGGDYASVGGGIVNIATGTYSVIGGGLLNLCGGKRSAVCGGDGNNADGQYSFVGGGRTNRNYGSLSSIPGGYHGVITNDGCFLWADAQEADYGSHGDYTFSIRASNGFWMGYTTTGAVKVLNGDGSLALTNVAAVSVGGYAASAFVRNSDTPSLLPRAYTNVTITTITPRFLGDWIIDIGITQSWQAFGPTTNDWYTLR